MRASAGSLFHLPLALEPGTTDVVGRAARRRRHRARRRRRRRARPRRRGRRRAARRPTAWLFGNEAWGLPDEVAALADHRVRIPIHGRAESLNLATAAAVCLYASARAQRRPDGAGRPAVGRTATPATRRWRTNLTAMSRRTDDVLDALPDGVVVADADGMRDRWSTPPPAGCSGSPDGGRQAPRPTWCCSRTAPATLVRLHRALRRARHPHPRSPSRRGTSPTAPSCWSPPGSSATGRAARCGGVAVSLRSARARERARPGALRPGRHRRPRAALAADRRQGLRRHAAVQVGQAQRRPEEADARDGQRRRRPAHPADRRAARRRPHRHRPALAVPAPARLRGRRRAGGRLGAAPAPAARSPSTSTATCPASAPTPTSSRRSSPTSSTTRSGTARGRSPLTASRDRRRGVVRRGAAARRRRGRRDQPGHPQPGVHEVLEARHPRRLRAGHVHHPRPGRTPTAARWRSTTRPAGGARVTHPVAARRTTPAPDVKPVRGRRGPGFLD